MIGLSRNHSVGEKPALTPTLSPKERETILLIISRIGDSFERRQVRLPLPGGECRGEGELFFKCIVTAKTFISGGISLGCCAYTDQ
jgi:hypothetical protein